MEKRKRILAVDDDADQIDVIRAVLEPEDYEVIEAGSEAKAIAKAKQEKPDLIVLDVMMEHTDGGFQVCQTLKKDPDTRTIPVLMLTAIGEKTGMKFSPETDGAFLPADGYMEKPIEPAEFLKQVQRLLR